MASPNKHLSKLQENLESGETIQATVAGTITTTATSTSGTVRGMLVLTDSRFLFEGGSWASKGSRSVPLSAITSIDLHKNLMTAHVVVTLAGGPERYMVKYNDAEKFVKTAHEVLARFHSPVATGSNVSAADELLKLADLHSRGLLTDDEFAVAKAKALS